MEDTQVIFVGGGPSGLALGLALAQHNVQVSTSDGNHHKPNHALHVLTRCQTVRHS